MLAPGLVATVNIVVGDADTAVAMGSGDVPVLATPRLIALLEAAAAAAVGGELPEGATTVGTKVEVAHLAATPPGDRVVCRAELTAVDGRRLTFTLEASDGRVVLARGTHERVVVDRASFLARVGRDDA